MGKAGCAIYAVVLVGIGIFFIYPDLTLTASREVSAIQLTQVYTGAMMWLLIVGCIGIGILMLVIDEIWTAAKKYFDPRFVQLIDQKTATAPATQSRPQNWEYCELIEGKQSGQRQMLKQLIYATGEANELSPDIFAQTVSILGSQGWELVSTLQTTYANAATEIRWIFRKVK